jgi:hypothetical protein
MGGNSAFQPPVVELLDGRLIVRDDLLPGGTKCRGLAGMLTPGVEYAYASPAEGFAQIALAITAAQLGAAATIFVAKRNAPHARTAAALAAGAKVIQVPHGYLSNVQAKARAYCDAMGARLLPFGLDCEEFLAGMAAAARGLGLNPPEVWCTAGSGVLTRAMQRAWPEAVHHAVAVGRKPDVGRAIMHEAPEAFAANAKEPPPFPSCGNYDAKAWRFFREAPPGALFWNVAA